MRLHAAAGVHAGRHVAAAACRRSRVGRDRGGDLHRRADDVDAVRGPGGRRGRLGGGAGSSHIVLRRCHDVFLLLGRPKTSNK